MENLDSKNKDVPQIELGLRHIYGFLLGTFGVAFIQMGLVEFAWGFWDFFWLTLGFLVLIKATMMMIELAKLLVYIILVIAVIVLVVSIFSSIHLTTPMAVVIAGLLIAMAIKNK